MIDAVGHSPSAGQQGVLRSAFGPWDDGVVESNVEIARRGYEAALSGDLESVREFLDPDVRWHGGDAEAPGACRNRDEALKVMAQAIGRAELVEIVGAGDKVVVIMRPIGAGGRRGHPVANLTTFRDGKAIEMVHYPEPAAALAAIGR
jgi:ketosteroid isomerase-like protein